MVNLKEAGGGGGEGEGDVVMVISKNAYNKQHKQQHVFMLD